MDDYTCALLVSDRKRGTSESGHDSRKRRQSEIAKTLNDPIENISLPFPIVISYLPGISYLKFEIEGYKVRRFKASLFRGSSNLSAERRIEIINIKSTYERQSVLQTSGNRYSYFMIHLS